MGSSKPRAKGPLFVPTHLDKLEHVVQINDYIKAFPKDCCRSCYDAPPKFRVDFRTAEPDSPIYYTLLCGECMQQPKITLALLKGVG